MKPKVMQVAGGKDVHACTGKGGGMDRVGCAGHGEEENG